MTPEERAAEVVAAWYAEPDNDEETLETRVARAIHDALDAQRVRHDEERELAVGVRYSAVSYAIRLVEREHQPLLDAVDALLADDERKPGEVRNRAVADDIDELRAAVRALRGGQ